MESRTANQVVRVTPDVNARLKRRQAEVYVVSDTLLTMSELIEQLLNSTDNGEGFQSWA